ncbi:hypothetical protein [Myxosarcina sp. GI1(2024)]
MFEKGKYQKHRALSLEATIAIISKIQDLLYFRQFTSSDFSFEIEAIRIEAKQLILWVKATIYQLPRSIESPLKTTAIEIN